MSQALTLAMEFGINHMQLHEVRAFTRPDNEKSIAVLKRNGFSLEMEFEGEYLKFIYAAENL
jgi:RimJ/RimL family protein N-acetyltransferase